MGKMKVRGRKCLAGIAAVAVIICSLLASGLHVQANSPMDILEGIEEPALDSIQAAPDAGNEAASSEKTDYPAFFVLIYDQSGEAQAYCRAALVADSDGSFYIIASGLLEQFDGDYKFMLCQGAYSATAKIVTVQDGISFLKADGAEEFLAYNLGRNWDEVKTEAYLWYLEINDSSEEVLSYQKIGNLTSAEQSDKNCAMGEFEAEYFSILGSMVADSKAESAVGIVTVDSGNKNVIIKNLDSVEYPKKAAIVTGSQSGSGTDNGKTEGGDTGDDDPGDADGGAGGTDGGDAGDTDGGDQGGTNTNTSDDNKGIFSDVPYWAWIIAAVVIVGAFLVHGSAKKGKKENPGYSEPTGGGEKDGTICLEPEPSPADAQKTMLQKPSGVQASSFLVRGVSGVFQGQIFQIGAVLRFGRASGSDVMFPQTTRGISSSHCELSMENGRIALRDVGSSYGTYMGQGVKLVPQVVYYLQSGDEFYLADRTQLFRVENINGGGTAGKQGLFVKGMDGALMGQTFFTGIDGKMYFGRGEGNQVHFGSQDTGISTTHCMLYQENGNIYLMDMNSMNGTFKDDGSRLRANVPYRMNAGDKFYLVNRRNSFRIGID